MGRRRPKSTEKTVFHHVITHTAQGIFLLQEPELKAKFNDLVDFYTRVFYITDLARACMSNQTQLVLEVNRPDFDKEDVRLRYELAQTRVVNKRPFRKTMAENFYENYTDLSRFMWEINRRLASFNNKLNGTDGHFWGGRFKNVVVAPGESLLKVIAEVELNSKKAQLAEESCDAGYGTVARIKIQQQGMKPKDLKAPLLKDSRKMFPPRSN